MPHANSHSTWKLASQGGYRWQRANCGRRYAADAPSKKPVYLLFWICKSNVGHGWSLLQMRQIIGRPRGCQQSRLSFKKAHLFHADIQRVQAPLLRLASRSRCRHGGFDCVAKRARIEFLADHANDPQRCSGSEHHHVGSSSGRSDLLISSVRRRNCPGNRPTAQPSPNGRRGSRQSPGGDRSPKHSWFYCCLPNFGRCQALHKQQRDFTFQK